MGELREGESSTELVDWHGDACNEAPSWGRTIGQGLRSVQFHSTLSGELLACFVYHDGRLRMLKRGQRLPEEEQCDFSKAWVLAARELRSALMQELSGACAGDRVDVVGRWKRRRLVVDHDFVTERFALADGRHLLYKQPEGQFSNPNSACEIHCLNWLCREAGEIWRECEPNGAKLLELHCGGGNNTVALAPYFDEIVAVEINRVLAEVAEENLRTNGIVNVQLVRAPSATAKNVADHFAARAILVDPPRSGLDADTLEVVAKSEHVLYISCNPDALADNLDSLKGSHEVCSFAFFDM